MPQDHIAHPLHQSLDSDYVTCFDALARVEIDIRRRGPSPHLLLRRAMLSMALGNYATALDAARDAVTAAPREPETHYQEGLALLWLARLQVGVATLGPGAPVPTQRPLRALLDGAYDAFCAASGCGDDAETESVLQWLEELLQTPDDRLADRLQAAIA